MPRLRFAAFVTRRVTSTLSNRVALDSGRRQADDFQFSRKQNGTEDCVVGKHLPNYTARLRFPRWNTGSSPSGGLQTKMVYSGFTGSLPAVVFLKRL